eukprot:2583591-Prymnesium_polylepis.1
MSLGCGYPVLLMRLHTLTIIVTRTPDVSSAIDPAPGARSKSDEKSGVAIMVTEIMRGVNHSQYGKVLQLLGASPQGVTGVTGVTRGPSTLPAGGSQGVPRGPKGSQGVPR